MGSEFLEVYDKYYDMIYRYAYIKLGNKWDAEDITSEVFRKAYVHFKSIKSNTKAWLFTTARNSVNDFYRRIKTQNVELKDDISSQQDWLEEGKIKNDELQMLSYSGRYCYLNPTWSSDSKTIYSIRRDYAKNKTVAVKIDLDNKALNAKTVVERYLQSIMLKDEDYQSSLAAVESEALNRLKYKNIIDYQIVAEGIEDETAYVDTILVFWNEVKGFAESFQHRFYLSNETGDFYIVDLN